MKASVQTAKDLFYAPGRYEIPIYQRPYVWEDQWSGLWEDVEVVAQSHLDGTIGHSGGHFLGAVVLQQQQTSPGELARWIVIDGQQRLLTLQVLLDAAEYAFRFTSDEITDYADELRDLIENKRRHRDKSDPDTRFKLWPTAGDQPDFRQAMSDTDGNAATDDDSLILRAHYYFREQVANWLSVGTGNLEERAEALQVTLADRLKFVSIALDSSDNPNVIFETLNARGTPLLDWDLAKNYMLHWHQLAGHNPDRLYNEWLKPLEEDEWWRENIRRGSAYVPRVDILLYNWLIYETHDLIRADHVFGAFTNYTKRRRMDEIAKKMVLTGGKFRELETRQGSQEWQRFLPVWHTLQAGIITPHLLSLKMRGVQGDTLRRALLAFESFFVRRAVCRHASRGGNRELLPLLSQMGQVQLGEVADVIVKFLREGDSAAVYWPTDEEFLNELVHGPMYRRLTRARTRVVLEGIEQYLQNQNAAVIKAGQQIFIEHVMPQSYAQHYPLAGQALDADESPQEQRERLLHTLGNLSLTTAKLGGRMSNRGWDAKRELLRNDTLSLNADLLKHSWDKWNDDRIIERGERLADIALEIWPGPDNI